MNKHIKLTISYNFLRLICNNNNKKKKIRKKFCMIFSFGFILLYNIKNKLISKSNVIIIKYYGSLVVVVVVATDIHFT